MEFTGNICWNSLIVCHPELIFIFAIHIFLILTFVYSTVWNLPVSVCVVGKLVVEVDSEGGGIIVVSIAGMTAIRVVLEKLGVIMEASMGYESTCV